MWGTCKGRTIVAPGECQGLDRVTAGHVRSGAHHPQVQPQYQGSTNMATLVTLIVFICSATVEVMKVGPSPSCMSARRHQRMTCQAPR